MRCWRMGTVRWREGCCAGGGLLDECRGTDVRMRGTVRGKLDDANKNKEMRTRFEMRSS